MKTKTKMIIVLSLAGVIALGVVIALVVVIASFNATAGSGLSVSYVAKNVEAEVSMGYLVSEENSNDPKSLTYTTVQAGSNDKLTFSSSDTAEVVSKSFDELDEIELTKDGYVYLKYTFKHTGTTENSQNYLNITLNNTFSSLNNVDIEYSLYNPDMSTPIYSRSFPWMAGVNGLTVTRDTDNECVLFARMYVDVKTQNALLDGSIVFNMTTSDTEYYANLKEQAMFSDSVATSVSFGSYTTENLSKIEGIVPTSLSADGSGPINKYQLSDGTTYILSDSEIFVTTYENMFHYCSDITSLDLSGLNTSNLKSMSYLFACCTRLKSLNLGTLDTSKVTSMQSLFSECRALTSIDLTPLDTSNVTDMSSMFYGCSGLTSLDLSSFNTSKVTTISCMFSDCSSLSSIDLTPLDTSNVTDMSSMFYDCSSLISLDLSSFDTSKVTTIGSMFCGCTALTTIYVSDSWNTAQVGDGVLTFYGCTSLVGGNGTKCDGAYGNDTAYARVDTAEPPGYFTLKTS